MKKLGVLTITVAVHDDGNVSASHNTQLAPALREMQGAMSAFEKIQAAAMRRKACAEAANFFLFIRDPNAPEMAADVAA